MLIFFLEIINLQISRTLQIIAPDEWCFGICEGGGTGGGSRKYSARPPDCAGKMLFAGSIDVLHYELFLSRVRKFLNQAQDKQGEKRSAAHNEQGHQKTPVHLFGILYIYIHIIMYMYI